jgi:hypothetical protein
MRLRLDHLRLQAAVVAIIAAAGDVMGQHKAPVPEMAAQAAVRTTGAEIYGSCSAEAKSADQKTALAAETVGAALKVRKRTPGQFVLVDRNK